MYGEKNLPRSPFAPRSEIGTEEQVDLPVVWVEQARFYQELLRYRPVLVVATVLATVPRGAEQAEQVSETTAWVFPPYSTRTKDQTGSEYEYSTVLCRGG